MTLVILHSSKLFPNNLIIFSIISKSVQNNLYWFHYHWTITFAYKLVLNTVLLIISSYTILFFFNISSKLFINILLCLMLQENKKRTRKVPLIGNTHRYWIFTSISCRYINAFGQLPTSYLLFKKIDDWNDNLCPIYYKCTSWCH